MRCKFSKLNICRLVAAFIAVTLAVALFVPCVSAANSGSCGSGVKWEFADGTLTISGKGAMDNYTEVQRAPWQYFRDKIRVINIGSGVTSVGAFSFYDYSSVKTVTIADTVTSIGNSAFAKCVKLSLLTLGSGLRSIGESAFERCESLQAVRLPDTLNSIGQRAFYRCYALRNITIPSSVNQIGIMTFAYCKGLVGATVNASVAVLPLWTFYSCGALADVTISANVKSVDENAFYNCDNLYTIYYLGTPTDGVNVVSDIKASMPDDPGPVLKCSANPAGQSQSTTTYPKDQNTSVVETVTVKESAYASISTTVAKEMTSGSQSSAAKDITVKVDAVVENNSGWNEVVEQVNQATVEAKELSAPKVQVSVNCNTDSPISGAVLSDLSGKNVNMTVNMNDGSAVKIDCASLEGGKISGSYNMSYSISENSQPAESHAQTLGDADSYVLSFTDDTELNFSPQIYVGEDRTHSCATLYQVESDGALTEVQSSIVDKEGNATFYLKSAYKDSEYVVAIDVLSVDRSTAIVPEDLKYDYGITDEFEQIIQYMPTEEREFLGMNIAQFSFVMFGTLALLVVVFGVVMGVFYRKKRLEMMYRLKMQEEMEQE